MLCDQSKMIITINNNKIIATNDKWVTVGNGKLSAANFSINYIKCCILAATLDEAISRADAAARLVSVIQVIL